MLFLGAYNCTSPAVFLPLYNLLAVGMRENGRVLVATQKLSLDGLSKLIHNKCVNIIKIVFPGQLGLSIRVGERLRSVVVIFLNAIFRLDKK